MSRHFISNHNYGICCYISPEMAHFVKMQVPLSVLLVGGVGLSTDTETLSLIALV